VRAFSFGAFEKGWKEPPLPRILRRFHPAESKAKGGRKLDAVTMLDKAGDMHLVIPRPLYELLGWQSAIPTGISYTLLDSKYLLVRGPITYCAGCDTRNYHEVRRVGGLFLCPECMKKIKEEPLE